MVTLNLIGTSIFMIRIQKSDLNRNSKDRRRERLIQIQVHKELGGSEIQKVV
jgi:hypothetical protein